MSPSTSPTQQKPLAQPPWCLEQAEPIHLEKPTQGNLLVWVLRLCFVLASMLITTMTGAFLKAELSKEISAQHKY